MASAWGNSWGKAWGSSWGSLTPVSVPAFQPCGFQHTGFQSAECPNVTPEVPTHHDLPGYFGGHADVRMGRLNSRQRNNNLLLLTLAMEIK